TVVAHVQDYRSGLLAYQHEIEALPEVERNLLEDQEPVWLRVPRLRKEPPPPPSEELRPWIILSDSPETEPTHRNLISMSIEGDKDLKNNKLPDCSHFLG